MANTIKIKNYSDIMEEYLAGASITPGHLIALNSSGLVVVHPTAEGNALPMFACENELIGDDIDHVYLVDERVQCWIPGRGDIVNALLEDGQIVVIGDFLESTGSGTLQKHVVETESWDSAVPEGAITVPTNCIVGVALEAVNLSGSANLTADGRILVRII